MDKNNNIINDNIITDNNTSITNKINLKNLDYIDDFNIWDIKSVFKYIISKPIEFLLLLFVFLIIYFVDYISQINTTIYGMSQSIPFFGEQERKSQEQPLIQKKKRRNK